MVDIYVIKTELCQTSKMECLAKIVYDILELTVFTKLFILDIWYGSNAPLKEDTAFAEDLCRALSMLLSGKNIFKYINIFVLFPDYVPAITAIELKLFWNLYYLEHAKPKKNFHIAHLYLYNPQFK